MGEIRKVIGENIKKVCRLKGIRQIDIAEHMGVSQGSVSNWIKGTNSIDIENLAELCAYLGVSLDQIYGVEPIGKNDVLSGDESELIGYYRSVVPIGQQHIISTARMVAGNPTMKRDPHADTKIPCCTDADNDIDDDDIIVRAAHRATRSIEELNRPDTIDDF